VLIRALVIDGRTDVDARFNLFGEDLADEMTPGIERDDFCRVAPLRARPDQGDRCGIGEVRTMIASQRTRRDRKCAIDRVCAGI